MLEVYHFLAKIVFRMTVVLLNTKSSENTPLIFLHVDSRRIPRPWKIFIRDKAGLSLFKSVFGLRKTCLDLPKLRNL